MFSIQRWGVAGLCAAWLLAVDLSPADAAKYQLAAAGEITANTNGDPTIPIGTPWSFELTYDTAAPDLDFELLGAADPEFGRFKNTAAPPALLSFHYHAGSYEVTLDDPTDFGEFSDMLITFTSIHAIDVNIISPAVFPQLAGGPVTFHADFNAFESAPVLTSDGLPTDVNLGPTSFDESAVTLILSRGFISSSIVSSFRITAVPEPGAVGMAIVGMTLVVAGRRGRDRMMGRALTVS
jgi:hypothetical protein